VGNSIANTVTDSLVKPMELVLTRLPGAAHIHAKAVRTPDIGEKCAGNEGKNKGKRDGTVA